MARCLVFFMALVLPSVSGLAGPRGGIFHFRKNMGPGNNDNNNNNHGGGGGGGGNNNNGFFGGDSSNGGNSLRHIVWPAVAVGLGDRRVRFAAASLAAAGTARFFVDPPRPAHAAELEEDEFEDFDEPVSGGRGLPRGKRSLRDFSLRDRLASVPVFFVANARGSPYLLNRGGDQECLLFLDPLDAEDLLSEMVQASPQLHDARVSCMGMDKAMTFLLRKPTASGNVDSKGNEMTLKYKIQASEREIKKHHRVSSRGTMTTTELPCYVAPEIEIKRGGIAATPVFFTQDDLYDAWNTANEKKKRRAPPLRKTVNLLELVLASDAYGGNVDFDKLLFYPMPRAVEYAREARKRGNGSSRLHVQVSAGSL